MVLTTHRIVCKTGKKVIQELHLFYISKVEKGGGLFHAPRIELTLDGNKLRTIAHPPNVMEYYNKVLKAKPKVIQGWPQNVHNLSGAQSGKNQEWQIRKFISKDSRDKIIQLLNDAIQ